MKPKRQDEEFCKHTFHSFLAHFYRSDNLFWEPVSPCQEPPDYYLRILNQRYAVEVTTVMEPPSPNHWQAPSAEESRLYRLVKRVERQAEQRGHMQGSYVVEGGPVDNFGTCQRKLRQALLEYIRRTREPIEAPRVVLHRSRRSEWAIRKYARYRNVIKLVAPKGLGDHWREEVCCRLRERIAERLDTKAKKLQGLSMPVILLLFDQYHYARRSAWTEASSALDLDQFHTVVRISDGGRAQILASARSDWSGAGLRACAGG